ncbi:MAG: peptidoglycan-binding protein, partial [Rhodospirillales bacterium]|nr:peptidoglycan-binding protein [Rhodospirillales bacterium]
GGGFPTIPKRSTGPSVSYCQNILNQRTQPPPLWVDGIFAAMTDARVRAFQLMRHLTVDGIVGPQTWAALHSGPPVAHRHRRGRLRLRP